MRSSVALGSVLALLLSGCPSEAPPPPVIVGDDDDSTGVLDDDDSTADDDDSAGGDDDDSAGDDDDSTLGDDDDATPPTYPLTITVDAPSGTVLAVQAGDGPFVEVTPTGMTAETEISAFDGHYALLLACTGSDRGSVQIHFSDAVSEPEPVIGCAEDPDRGLAGGSLSGLVAGTNTQTWMMSSGSRRWPARPGTLNDYIVYLPADNYDLFAARLDSNGLPNKVMLYRVLDSGNDPEQPLDFNNDASFVPHVPANLTLDIDETGTATNTVGAFLTRGGSLNPLGARPSADPVFEILANERRVSTDMFLFRTDSTHGGGCTGQTMTILTSDRVIDFNTALNSAGERHGAPIVPVEPQQSSVCNDFASTPAIAADALTLTADFSTALGAGNSMDMLRAEMRSPSNATRWIVTSSADRDVVSVDLTDTGTLLGNSYPAPTAGWSLASSAWEAPVAEVLPSHLALVLATDLYSSLPTGRSRWQYEALPNPSATGNEVRSHEYNVDDLTREFVFLPWSELDYSAHGIARNGTL